MGVPTGGSGARPPQGGGGDPGEGPRTLSPDLQGAGWSGIPECRRGEEFRIWEELSGLVEVDIKARASCPALSPTSVVCVTVSGPHLSAFVPLVSFLVSVSLFLPSSPSKALSLFPSPPFCPSHSASHTSNPPPAPWLAEDALEGGTGVVRRGLQRTLKLEEGTEGLGGNNRTGAPAPVQPGRLRAQWLS